MSTTTDTTNEVARFSKKFLSEYVRQLQFSDVMGKSENHIIQIRDEPMSGAGSSISIPMVGRLTNAGVTGGATLEGSEEALDNWGHQIDIDDLANGVRWTKWEQQKTEIDYMMASRAQLKNWAMERLRDDIIAGMQSPVVDGSTEYASASEAQKDAWLLANTDRVLFGAAKSNNASNDHSAALANIDSTNDTLDTGMISLAKRMAKTADRHIRPVKIENGAEFFVMYCNSLAFRDLAAESAMQQANRDALQRGRDNPLFTGGDLIWDGVIIKEVPEIGVISGVGASSIDVAPNFLCGAQTIGS